MSLTVLSGGRFGDALPDSPPREVLEQMATAGLAQDRLAAAGETLHFRLHPETGRLSVEVLDPAGTVLRTVPPSTVLHVAAGGALA